MPPNNAQADLNAQLISLNSKLDQLIESHGVLVDSIAKIKEAIYHPDQGIYSRLRDLERENVRDGEIRLAKIEETIAGIKRIQWMVIGSGVVSLVGLGFKMFISG